MISIAFIAVHFQGERQEAIVQGTEVWVALLHWFLPCWSQRLPPGGAWRSAIKEVEGGGAEKIP